MTTPPLHNANKPHTTSHPAARPDNDFASQAEGDNQSIIAEFWALLRHNKKWWLLPVIVALLVLGVLVILGSTAAAPFIYTLF